MSENKKSLPPHKAALDIFLERNSRFQEPIHGPFSKGFALGGMKAACEVLEIAEMKYDHLVWVIEQISALEFRHEYAEELILKLKAKQEVSKERKPSETEAQNPRSKDWNDRNSQHEGHLSPRDKEW